ISNIQFTGNDGASLVQAAELDAAEDLTLADKFENGDTVSFELEVAGEEISVTDASGLQDVVAQINGATKDTGVSAFLNSDGNEIVFASAKGENFQVSMTTDINSDDTNEVNVSLDTSTAENADVSLNSLDISTREGADEALVAIDFAIDQVNNFRSDLGAVQNRFESTITNLNTSVENLSASNSRIVDADFAAETANLSKSQVLQQAGISVLAQANARPQQVLSLLQ
ncbi:flagellin, partial [Marinobacter sp.]|uniref:flagellin n=1 Tax=Marinobacter sp. TaxID=50741 RepID=UPI00356B372A